MIALCLCPSLLQARRTGAVPDCQRWATDDDPRGSACELGDARGTAYLFLGRGHRALSAAWSIQEQFCDRRWLLVAGFNHVPHKFAIEKAAGHPCYTRVSHIIGHCQVRLGAWCPGRRVVECLPGPGDHGLGDLRLRRRTSFLKVNPTVEEGKPKPKKKPNKNMLRFRKT